MAYGEKAKSYAFGILEQRRAKSGDIDAVNRAALYERVPDLPEFDRRTAALGIALSRAALGGEDIQKLSADIAAAAAERTELLKKSGIPKELYTPHAFCDICGDSGYTGGKLCACAEKLLREYTLAEISRVSPIALSSFSRFSLDFYSAESDGNYGTSPKKNMKKVLDCCLSFAKEFPKGENLLMMGDAGLGKTHLALSIAGEVLRRGYGALYCSAANIFKVIETEYFEKGREAETLDSLKHCDLLVLDDLGAEFLNAFTVSAVYDIVNTRITENLSTIYTTNITKTSLLETRYGEKVSSRLTGCCRLLSFFGDDIRLMRK